MTTNTEALREQFELYVNPEGDIKLHRLVDGSYAGHGLNQSWMDFQAGHAAGVAAEREVEMSEELPAVARLYYSGNGHRRYKRASTRSGPGEPLCFVSVASYALRRRDAEIAMLRLAIQKTLDENGHLADGDNCTLIRLKRALETPNTQVQP